MCIVPPYSETTMNCDDCIYYEQIKDHKFLRLQHHGLSVGVGEGSGLPAMQLIYKFKVKKN